MPPSLTRIRDAILVGALAGLAAGLVFATLHALIIVPIWDRMFGGLFGAVLTGAVVAWGYAELHPEPSAVSASALSGARFGALLWLVVTPVSIVDAVLRALGFLPRHELVGVVIALILCISAGAIWGWRSSRRIRGMISVAAATLALTLAMAGPVPIGRSIWAFGIFLAVLPACVIAGLVLGSFVGLAAGWRPHAVTGVR
jgi:hypothetical protein